MKQAYKNKFLLALYAGLALTMSANTANASKLNEWFPQIFGPPEEKIEGPLPEETLESPFKNHYEQPQRKNALSNLKQDDIKKNLDYTQKHRTSEQIGEWLTDIIAQTLTMQTSGLKQHAAEVANHFTLTGQYELNKFIDETNIINIMEKYNVRLSSIVNATPELKEEESVNGYYTWLFTVPVTLTYIPINFTEYKAQEIENIEQASFRAIHMPLLIQVRRVEEKTGEHDVKIELWRKGNE